MHYSYATFGLMSGTNPAFMAKQLGRSIEDFFKTYAKWIDSAGDAFQSDLIDKQIEKSVLIKP